MYWYDKKWRINVVTCGYIVEWDRRKDELMLWMCRVAMYTIFEIFQKKDLPFDAGIIGWWRRTGLLLLVFWKEEKGCEIFCQCDTRTRIKRISSSLGNVYFALFENISKQVIRVKVYLERKGVKICHFEK